MSADTDEPTCLCTGMTTHQDSTLPRPHLPASPMRGQSPISVYLPLNWLNPSSAGAPCIYIQPPPGADLALLRGDAVLSAGLEQNSSVCQYKLCWSLQGIITLHTLTLLYMNMLGCKYEFLEYI